MVSEVEMQQYIEILLYRNILCRNTIQYNTADLGYRYIAYIASASDNFNDKLIKLSQR